MDRPEFKHATFGVAFYSLADGRMVWSQNADKLFVAASTTKLLTEGTALQLLGADYRFHTRVYRTGRLNGNIVEGDLVLVASAMGALFLSQLQQFVLATGASAAVQNLVQAGALALAVTVYGLRLRPGRLRQGRLGPGRLAGRARARPPTAPPSRDGTADPQPDDHRAPVT